MLNHNIAAAYLVPARTDEILIELLDDFELEKVVHRRLVDDQQLVKVDLDDL